MRDCKGRFLKGHPVPEEWRLKLRAWNLENLQRRTDLWTEEQICFLKEFYGRIPAREIAKRIGRGYDATKKKARQLGLHSKLCGTNKGKSYSYNDPKRSEPLKLNEELAYVLGVLYGDGYVGKRKNADSYVVVLKVKDQDFAETFTEMLKKLGYKPRFYHYPYRKVPFHVELTSKELYLFFESFKVGELLKTEHNLKAWFLRGFLDSEGSIINSVKVCLLYTSPSPRD